MTCLDGHAMRSADGHVMRSVGRHALMLGMDI